MPDWLTPALAVSTPFIGLAGVWLGSWLNQRGAERLSKQTLESQRALANDAARREWRRQQVAPYVEAATQRVSNWLAADEARFLYNQSQELLVPHHEQRWDSNFNLLQLLVYAVPDKAFRDAFLDLARVELPMSGDATLTEDQAVEAIARIRVALVAVNETAERYIFSTHPE